MSKKQLIVGDAASPIVGPVDVFKKSTQSTPCLLIIDDDKIFRMAFTAMARDMGNIVETDSGKAGLEYLKNNDVDLILLDMVMPGMSGFDVLEALAKEKKINKIPVLLLSSTEDDESIAHAFKLGAVDYLRKPVRKYELIARLTTQLELRYRQLHLEQMVEERTRELTEANQGLKAAQEQLMQSDKMAAIGQLAAGVAHEINNPVGFVSSNLSTLTQYLDDVFRVVSAYESIDASLAAEQQASLQAIKKEIDLGYLKSDISELLRESRDGLARIIRIVQDMKNFSHIGENKWELVNIHDGIETTLNIVHNEIKYKAKIVRDFDETGLVQCMPSQINQVLMNLMVNASHAMEADGTLTIKTRQEANKLKISISDTGCGMPPEVVKKIFNPFFTTKPVGKGTGLGLSLSYTIIAKHHGSIDVESQPGKGTTFVVTLPMEQPVMEQDETEME